MTRRNLIYVYLLALGAFFTATSELVVGGLLNIIAEDMEVSVSLAGQLVTAYSLAFAIGTPVVVALTSRMKRKSVLSGSLLVFLLGSIVALFSGSFGMLMVSRIVLGLSSGVYAVVAIGSVAKLVPPERTGRAVGMIALAFSLSMVLGVPMGIAISDWWDWRAVFAVLGAATLPIFFILRRMLPDIEGDEPVPFKSQFAVFRQRIVLATFLLSFLWASGNSIIYSYMTPFLQTVLRFTTGEVGAMLLALGIFGMLGSRLGGIGVDRLGTVRMLVLSLTLHIAALALLPLFEHSTFGALAVIILWAFSMFMSAPALNTYFIQLAPRKAQFVLGLNTSFTHLGLAAGAGAGGLMIDWSATPLYNPWLASLLGVVGMGIAWYSFRLKGRIVPSPAA
ncbi:MFS transporter [Cohnella thailandensis]|uniref:MFS transporter n=1 Tax=Cohnella thailandensis TaxID=557557 RepID=A0A841SYK5_9BACL|nr:MFS transporter [Cohnella thailandensis]MBB6634920.1 MFS transporter [Cohnella thailandensis]MBP1975858.1 DHA1 family putative efflux transporter-like MFS transporter [Cohnella thailandensis]